MILFFQGQFMDVISFNRYNAWYVNSGKTDTITNNVIQEAKNWHKKYNKPVLMTEYGGDAIAGLHLVCTCAAS
jgi:beta-glucuronidase